MYRGNGGGAAAALADAFSGMPQIYIGKATGPNLLRMFAAPIPKAQQWCAKQHHSALF